MSQVEIIREVIIPSIKELGFDIQENDKLIGPQSILDSLSLVTLLATIEEKIATIYGKSVTLASESALSRNKSPFLSVITLSDYILELLSDAK